MREGRDGAISTVSVKKSGMRAPSVQLAPPSSESTRVSSTPLGPMAVTR